MLPSTAVILHIHPFIAVPELHGIEQVKQPASQVLECLQPTQQLQHFFKACDYDMTDLVAARIEQMAQSVFPLVPSSEHALQALQAAMNNERRQQVHRLQSAYCSSVSCLTCCCLLLLMSTQHT